MHPACPRPTREGKPYCLGHVVEHPYVLEVLRGSEVDQLQRGLPVDPLGRLGTEALSWLEGAGGEAPVEAVAVALSVSRVAAARLLEALDRAGLVAGVRRGVGAVARLLPREAEEDAVFPFLFEQPGTGCCWVGVIPRGARGSGTGAVEASPAASGARQLGRLLESSYARVLPFTRPLSRPQARLALFHLQERRADMIPKEWWTKDPDARSQARAALRAAGFFPRPAAPPG